MSLAHRVLVTGATGFLGGAIADTLERTGWLVRRCGRQPPADGRDWRPYDLNWTTLPDDFLAGVRTLVHAAVVPASANSDSVTVNVAGARALIDAARDSGVKFVFISSLAAHAAARSNYGRQKSAIESRLGDGDLTIRPGLIIGPGGIFARLAAHVITGRPIPLLGRGSQPLQTIYIDDLLASVELLLRANATGTIVLAEEPAVAYRVFFQTLGAHLGHRNRLVDVPSWFLLAIATWAQRLHLPVPIDRDNVLGLMEMQFMAPTADPRYRLPAIRPYAASIEAFCRTR